VVEAGTGSEPGLRSTVTVSADEPVFAGHYPNFPIFPGVCLVEYVHNSALATLPESEGEWELTAVESTRFLSPVFPRDGLSTELTWTGDGAEKRCKGVISSSRGDAAQVTLRFAKRGPE